MPRFFCIILLLCVSSFSCSEKRYTDALSPEEAIHSFSLNDDDFKIELFAAEPFVTDPVEMVFDEEGNVFVVELPDYPFRPESGIGSGKIRMLIDTSGDGRIDKSVIYADSLLEATSILPWNGGLIVAAAPSIFFLKDTNGDNRADLKEMLYTGFFQNNVEYQVTNLRFGIDNWIYAANFGQEGKVTSVKNPNKPAISVRGGDFRFRMDREQFEVESGPTQFGQTINDWGNRFITDNSLHIQQPVIPWRYLQRNPYLRSTNATVNISDHDPVMYQITQAPYWRVERTKRRNQSYQENNLDRVEYEDDHFTGACGTAVYGADAFPEKYYGNIFIAEVAGNLVHRDVVGLHADSITYVAKRDETEKNKEFLTSTDPWFRPVNFTVGPDGSLYVIDMYRQHIEGPAF
ncbi:MAG: dehydrogenase, partial [Bacteroidetes bacterium]|nr:dehydrogenase [Bacteroidota bacterium]